MSNWTKDLVKMKVRGLTTWLLVLSTILVARSGETAKEARVVCYYTNWSVYRPGTAKFNPQNINPYLCTHLIYAFGGFTKENTLKPFDKYQDIEKGGYAKFTGLKTYNPNLKTMIAIGGWNEGSSRFSALVASSERRREFVKNAVKFLRQNKFDGLDLDWEYPSFRDGGKPKDKTNYAKLVQDLREEFEKESDQTGRPRLLLTMAVPAGIEYIDKGYDIPRLNRYLDWMNILSYDYHSAFEPSVNHHSPLYSLEAASEYNFDSELNIDYTIKHYMEAGADPEKLVLGIPTYGRSFTLVNPESYDLGAPADGPGEQGEATREKGYLAYYEICENLLPKSKTKREAIDDDEEYEDEDEEWVVVQPNPKAIGPYAYKGNQWVGYDDIDIVRKKAEYVAEKSLGGIMFWSIDNDDFRGKCHGKPYPLIEAAKEALYRSLGVTETIVTKKPQATRKRPRPTKTSKIQDTESIDEKNTIKATKKGTKVDSSEDETKSVSKSTSRRRQNLVRKSSTTESSISSNTPQWGLNTPEPPTTPDPGSDFKCEEEGFFPHPRDCKKYFWCLESGPSNLGIVAHQFTCPSGLYFNKAADSCDFARNVLCNKKKTAVTSAPPSTTTTKATTTATKTFTTSEASVSTTFKSPLAAFFTTRRPPPRITAATSSTTLLSKASTTTPSTIEEEYEDEEIPEEGILDSEEDPRVIKELVALIKKLGGVEQLEKHLAGTSNTGQGTQTNSKLLYERVLSQTRVQNERAPSQQNSRGPQTAGLRINELDENVNLRRERPQYTTINRQRPSTTERAVSNEEVTEKDESEEVETRTVPSSSRPGLPQYVNIRRARPSTTEAPESTARYALFERNNENDSREDEDKNRVQNIEYSTIGRIRQNAEVTTSRYKTIQRTRGTTVGTTLLSEVNSISKGVSENEFPTESSTLSSPVSTSPRISNVISEFSYQSTQVPGTEGSTLSERDNDVTEANVAVSPSFASENGVITNTGSSSVLNAQISTLSNTPRPTDEGNSNTPSIISYSTKVTISEEPYSPTQRSTLFPKRTRPTTTTAKPQEITEQTQDNKVSSDRRYGTINRTRIFASSTTSPPLLKARTRNEVSSDSSIKDSSYNDDSVNESNDSLVKNKLRQGVRKIRSTTPASHENQSEAVDNDYGSKRPLRPQLQFNSRRSQNVNGPPISSDGANGRNRPNTLERSQPSYRTRKFLATDQANIDNEESGNEFVQTEVKTSRPVVIRRYRPSLNDFRPDLSTSTSTDQDGEVSTGYRNTLIRRRYRPSFSTTEQTDDGQYDDDSAVSSSDNRQGTFGFRGDRYSRVRSTSSSNDFELNTEASESSFYSRGRDVNVARFTPRPFTASSASELNLRDIYGINKQNENELNNEGDFEAKLVAKARLSAPVINVSNEDNKNRPLFRLPVVSSTSSSQQSINVTKVINSNTLIGQVNNRSGILLVRRPSRPVSVTTSATTQEDNEDENIHLSESSIEEKEHEDDKNVSVSNRPRKRIVVKKLKSSTTGENLSTTESSVIGDSVIEGTSIGNRTNQPTRRRIVKVIRKQPTSTTQAEVSTTERYDNNIIETPQNKEEAIITESRPDSSPRRVKIVRKLKPVLTEEGKTRLLQTKDEEQISEEELTSSTIDETPSTTSTVNDISSTSPLPPTEESLKDISSTTKIVQIEEDLEEDQTTFPSLSTKAKSERPSYRPVKKLLITSSTEPSTVAANKTYSRKYNNAPFTTPITPSERDQALLDKARNEALPRKPPVFNSRPFNRRPTPTVRTTTTDEDEYEEEPEVIAEKEPEDKVVILSPDQFFSRGPVDPEKNEARQVSSTDEGEDEAYESEEEEVEPEVKEEVKEEDKNTRVSGNVRNRFNAPQRPFVQRVSNVPQNRPSIVNRPVASLRPATDNSTKRFNRPVSFQSNRANRFGASTTKAPIETTTRYNRRFPGNRPAGAEPPSTTETVKTEAINAIRKQLFSNPKQFSTSTLSPLGEDTTDGTTDAGFDTATDVDVTETETDVDLLSPTEESVTRIDEDDNAITDSAEATTLYSSEADDTKSEKSSTEKHRVFSLNDFNSRNKPDNTDDTLPPIINILTTSTAEPIESNTVEPVIRTSSQLDKLFEVSRVVEVSSKQEKHRLNRKNESRLIEKTELKQEKKPRLDKIGEVSRYTLIKIVESDIPFYLTNLSHEYPVPNPPDNPIRIDEARNAKTLINFSDSGKENLIASESVNAAYNHRNAFIEFVDAPSFSDAERKQFFAQKKAEDKPEESPYVDESTDPPIESRFVPGALDIDVIRGRSLDIVTSKSVAANESSTLSLEGLFNSDGSQKADETVKVTGNQPFVVYAAAQQNNTESDDEKSGRSLTNYVKIQVIKSDEDTKAKSGKEFLGVPAAVDVLLEKEKPIVRAPFTVSILNQELKKGENATMTEPTVATTSTTEAVTNSTSTTKEDPVTTDPTTIPTEGTTETATTESTIIKIKPVNNTLNKIGQKRPKLAFPRRQQTQFRSSNVTRVAITPTNQTSKGRAETKNVPFTTPKYNRTNSYTSGRSRFSAIKSQNVPVDTRKPKEQATNATTVVTRAPSETRTRVTIKPFRSNLLARRTTTPPTQTAELSTEAATTTRPFFSPQQRQGNSTRVRPAFIPRRSSSRFTPRPETTTQQPTRVTDTSLSSRRRPTRPQTSTQSAVRRPTEQRKPPARVYVRKQTGLVNKTIVTTTTAKPLETATRRNFRIGVRRRPSTSTTTVAPAETTTLTNNELQSGHPDQEFLSTIHEDKDSEDSLNRRKVSIKLQRRPVGNQILDENNNSDKDQRDEKQTDKIYSSVLKEDRTLVQQEKTFDASKNELKYKEENEDAVTAEVALAAHQLLSAPLPTIPSYALGDEGDDGEDDRQFTRAYLLASSASPIITHNDFVTTEHPKYLYSHSTKSRRISTTVTPRAIYTTPKPVARRRPGTVRNEFVSTEPILKNYRTFVDYEYYDDDDTRYVGKSGLHDKVILRDSGVIQCLDQGNFAHPESCKKFISCARMENGEVYGWAYTCPKGLSFDPIGGICNWSSGLGCSD